MSIIKRLTDLNIDPEHYLAICREIAKQYKLNYKTLEFSNAKNKKLSIKDNDNHTVNFGSALNNDYIIWSILEHRKVVKKGYADMKKYVFHKSHEAMHYDKTNPYSANNLSLNILW